MVPAGRPEGLMPAPNVLLTDGAGVWPGGGLVPEAGAGGTYGGGMPPVPAWYESMP